ncbi:cell division protein FtsQ/DivIB [Aestuariimicrobium sp. Y1814]|uniref:cell division protein FtsQ/DivIB n=1 Tax=Aestuariimicrobium sp. Y1814 TaxID=3418742 RepID=UPI003DA71925
MSKPRSSTKAASRTPVAALPASIADASIALRRKKSRDRRRRWRRAAVVALVGLVVAALVWLVGFSSVLAVKQVEVDGLRLLAAAEVESRAQVPMGRPMARVNTDHIVDRVATLPAVESVRVERRWPSTIVISITERTPVIALHIEGSYKWADATGNVFHQTEALPDGLVVVEAPEDQRILADLATVAGSLTDELRARVQKITAESPDTITLVLDGDQTVIWGSAAESATKAQVATAMLDVEATVFDVSAPANPTSR